MIFLYIIPLSFSAGLGVFLNGAYYRTSYLNSGYGEFYSWVLAIAFMLFESVLWMYVDKNEAITVLKVSIVIYSVSMTLGAQFFSTSLQESETAELIFEETDISGDVEYYRGQIKTQDERINQIFRQRENDFVFTRTEASLNTAQTKKAEYEALLKLAQGNKESGIEKINSPKTIYSWLAYDLPEIFVSGISENLVRTVFQLFASLLLALMAPISLSMIRMCLNSRKPETEKPIEGESNNTVVPEVKKPEIVNDVKEILKMLLFYYPDKILSAERASEYFLNVHNSRPEKKAYSVGECAAVLNKVLPLEGKEKIDIMRAVLNDK